MPNFDILKPLAVHSPRLFHKIVKIIDAHGDSDGTVELSDVVDSVKEATSHIFEAVSEVLD